MSINSVCRPLRNPPSFTVSEKVLEQIHSIDFFFGLGQYTGENAEESLLAPLLPKRNVKLGLMVPSPSL
jgi:hypothetical protein